MGHVEDVKRLLDEGSNVRERAPVSPQYYDSVTTLYEPLDLLGGVYDQFHVDQPPEECMIECMYLLVAAGATTKTERDSLCELITNTCKRISQMERVDTIRAMLTTTDSDINTGVPKTPLEIAVLHGKYHIAGCLLAAGARPTSHAFQTTVRYGTLENVFLFLQHGADPYATDDDGRNALDWIQAEITWAAGSYFRKDREDTKHYQKLKVFEDLFECRRRFDALKDDLHRDLMEYAWNPQRLARFGYFDEDDVAPS